MLDSGLPGLSVSPKEHHMWSSHIKDIKEHMRTCVAPQAARPQHTVPHQKQEPLVWQCPSILQQFTLQTSVRVAQGDSPLGVCWGRYRVFLTWRCQCVQLGSKCTRPMHGD